MKVGITKLIMVAAIAAVVAMGGVTPVLAQNPNFPNFSSVANLTFNGNAAQAGTVLRVTPAATFQDGSVWFNTPQPVAGAFSTTFTFQLSGTTSYTGDGFAFVIQNSALTALGPSNDGCGLGFGDSITGCTPTDSGGIPQSLAVGFDTYQNADDPNNNHVEIQSCLMGPNSVDVTADNLCLIADNPNLTSLPTPVTLADGNVHTVVITYSGPGTKLLDVILDGNDLFNGGVVFDMTKIGLDPNSNAWVGFTAATGAADDNQDILSWTFTPNSQSVVLPVGTPEALSFPNANGTNVYSYTATLTQPYANPVLSVLPILSTTAACDTLVQKNFWPARCFVYQNAQGTGLDAPVMFAVTCPTSPGGTCGSNVEMNFFATLGTQFSFTFADNPFFVYPGVISLLNPFPGWLKGVGNNPDKPCDGVVFTSNQIESLTITGDPGNKTVGGTGGGGSCWVATYDTPFENVGFLAGPGINITSPKGSYPPNTVVNASYTCSNPSTSQPLSSATGPYLTAASCKQSVGTQNSCTFTPIVGPGNLGGQSCTGTFTTPAKKGKFPFVVTAIDSGGNQNLGAVIYTVTSH